MSSRAQLLRDVLVLAAGVFFIVVVVIGSALVLGGMFSWVWFARVLFAIAVMFALLEFFILLRAMRVSHVMTPLLMFRRVDQTQGCSVALLGALITAAMLLCGGLLEWVLEWK